MFNPYVSEIQGALRPVRRKKTDLGLGNLMERLSHLDNDDLIILLLVFLLARQGDQDSFWPLAAALLYLIL